MKNKDPNILIDFMPIAKAMVKKSNGEIRLVYKEKDKSNFKDQEAGHFLKFNEERIGKDIEFYNSMSVKYKVGHALPDFFLVLLKIKYDCPLSYSVGVKMIKKIGNNLFKDKLLENWNNLLK